MWLKFPNTKTNPATGHVYAVGARVIAPEDSEWAEGLTLLVPPQATWLFTEHEFAQGNPHNTAQDDIPGLVSRFVDVEGVAESAYNNANTALATLPSKMGVFTADAPMYFDADVLKVDTAGFPTNQDLADGLDLKVDKTTTVNGHALSSNVAVTKSEVGLGDADNTSDANKPVSTAQQTALDAKQPLDADLTAIAGLDSSTAGAIASDGAGWIKKTYAQFKTALGLVKADVGLGNADNTSDANKPVSTAQQTALNLKENTIAAGTTAQYWRGDKTWQTFPTVPAVVSWFKTGGAQTTPTKIWMDTVVATSSNGLSIDITSAGFSAILGYQVVAIRNTGTVTSCPNVSVKTVSTSAIVVNIVEFQTSLVSVLGFSVLQGLPVLFANTSGLSVGVVVWGT